MKGYWYDFIFNFFKDSLAGVTFDVYAKEDIVSADGLDTVYHLSLIHIFIIIVLIVLYSLARTAGESDRILESIREQSVLGREESSGGNC